MLHANTTLDTNVVITELTKIITELNNHKKRYETAYPYLALNYGAIEAMFRDFANKIGITEEIN